MHIDVRRIGVGCVVATAVLLAGRGTVVVGEDLYVDADASGPAYDGSNWCNAYMTLSDALTVVVPPATIRVANGTYRPGTDGLGDPREATFQLLSGVRLEGGYAGCGADDPDARDVAAYETILSGDLNQDDQAVACTDDLTDCDGLGELCGDGGFCIIAGNNVENSYHVVTGSGAGRSALLSGFTIMAGNANVDDPFLGSLGAGGGMYNREGNPSVTDCTFKGNAAARAGGAICNRSDSSPNVTHCTFVGNSANSGGGIRNEGGSSQVAVCTFIGNSACESGGGGISNVLFAAPSVTGCTFVGNSAQYGGGMSILESSPTVSECTFEENHAYNWGGGMYNKLGGGTVEHCLFEGNIADSSGGGVYNKLDSGLRVRYSTFGGNQAHFGGGITNDTISEASIFMCTFSDNVATDDGGGMFNNGSTPSVIECSFDNNTAVESGGGMACNFASPLVSHCVFRGNSAVEVNGGGMRNKFNSHPTVTRCTFIGNSAPQHGGGMNNDSECSPIVTNCVFSGNSAGRGGAMNNHDDSHPVISNCSISGNIAADTGGGLFNSGFGSDPSSPLISNSILWGNVADADGDAGGPYFDSEAQIYSELGMPIVNYSIVQGGWTGAGGIGNISVDPAFVDADGPNDVLGTDDDDLRLSPGSPAIDAGDNAAVTSDAADADVDGDLEEVIPFDLDGEPRFVDDFGAQNRGSGSAPVVDLGAFEFLGATPCLQNADCTDSDVCSFDQCIESVCTPIVGMYADLGGADETCGPDGEIDINDVFRVIDGFQNVFVDGCGPVNIDIAGGPSHPCGSDGVIDIADILAVLDAFQSVDTCCSK